MEIIKELQKQQDKGYAEFQVKLVPNINPDTILGVRVPIARKIAKTVVAENGYGEFINNLPHTYFDENIVHSIIISELKDYDKCIYELEKFLPYIDNWAVCDILNPKCFKKNKQKLLDKIIEWIGSDKTYICRFGLGMLMGHFLDADFKPIYLTYPAKVVSDEYYVNMMVAWLFATALAKQWDYTVKYIEEKKLPKWVHNKTIQKAVESYRITDEQKEYLRSLKY